MRGRDSAGRPLPTAGRRRRAGSVRFDPYWKVQWWDATSLTWRDIQRAHHTKQDALDTAAMSERYSRIMEITESGRRPVAWVTEDGTTTSKEPNRP